MRHILASIVVFAIFSVQSGTALAADTRCLATLTQQNLTYLLHVCVGSGCLDTGLHDQAACLRA